MSTPYMDIYNRFLGQINDHTLASYTDEELQDLLLSYLQNSIPQFVYCTKDLADRDDTTGQFNIDLTDQEKMILAKLMVVQWLSPTVNNMENLRMKFGNRDFQLFSSSQHLKELNSTLENRKKEVDADMQFYYYNSG